MRKLLTILIVLIGVLTTSCQPQQEIPVVGETINIPADTEAVQVKSDKTGLETCILPAQEVKVERNTYWQTFLGSTEGYKTTNLSEIQVSDHGTCDSSRSVLMLDEDLLKLK